MSLFGGTPRWRPTAEALLSAFSAEERERLVRWKTDYATASWLGMEVRDYRRAIFARRLLEQGRLSE